jgi:hypothetical protein
LKACEACRRPMPLSESDLSLRSAA